MIPPKGLKLIIEVADDGKTFVMWAETKPSRVPDSSEKFRDGASLLARMEEVLPILLERAKS